MTSTRDRNGKDVHVGTTVRVLTIDKGFLQTLPDDERPFVAAMVGMEFVVTEVDNHGHANVESMSEIEHGKVEYHSVCLAPEEMEVVEE